MAPARTEAIADTGVTGWPCSHSESYAARNMEQPLAFVLGSPHCVRSGRVKGTECKSMERYVVGHRGPDPIFEGVSLNFSVGDRGARVDSQPSSDVRPAR